LAETLGVTPAARVELDQAPAVRVVGPTDVVRLWSEANGSAGDLLVGLDERVHVELWHWRLVPGERHPSEAHRAGTRELIHVLEGELTLEVDAAEHAVAAGGAALFEADHDHAYRNDGAAPVDLVMVVLQPDDDLDEWRAEAGDPATA
jgi:quercetin dioxygenase-like cupin family protein